MRRKKGGGNVGFYKYWVTEGMWEGDGEHEEKRVF